MADNYYTTYANDNVSAIHAICDNTPSCSQSAAGRLIEYHYDNQARLDEIQRPVSVNTSHPDGVITEFSYDSVSRLTEMHHRLKSATDSGIYENVAFRNISYNPANQILNLNTSNGNYQWRFEGNPDAAKSFSFTACKLEQLSFKWNH